MIISGWLAGGSNNGQIARLEWLVEVPGLDVLAMTSISGISQGVFQGIPGAAAATVTEYGIVSSPLPQDIPDDPVNNAFYIYGCSYIRFRLTVVQANAYSHAAAFPLNPASFKKIDVGTKAFSIRSKDSGDLLAAYRICATCKVVHQRFTPQLTEARALPGDPFLQFPRNRVIDPAYIRSK